MRYFETYSFEKAEIQLYEQLTDFVNRWRGGFKVVLRFGLIQHEWRTAEPVIEFSDINKPAHWKKRLKYTLQF
jgi:hypothetical protein